MLFTFSSMSNGFCIKNKELQLIIITENMRIYVNYHTFLTSEARTDSMCQQDQACTSEHNQQW